MSAVDEVLAERRQTAGLRSRAGVAWSLAVHVAVGVAVLVVPRLSAQRPQVVDYVPVTILPVQALGAAPAPPTPQRPLPTPPKPTVDEPPPPVVPDPEIPQVKAPPPKPTPPVKKPETKPEVKPVAPRPTNPAANEPPVDEPSATKVGSAEGNVLGQSAFGQTQASLDNPDFTYGYYVDQMLQLIRDHWVRPPLGSGVAATVHFVIQKDGRVSDVEIVDSSGYSSFDLAGLRAVQSASPLPPLPRSYRHDTLGVNLVIR
jgi:TonB family protein